MENNAGSEITPAENLNDISEAVTARVNAEKESLGPQDAGPEITPSFVLDCLAANEMGDGVLFATLHKDRFVFSKTEGLWYRWTGHYWESDLLDTVFKGVENVALKYLEVAAGTGTEELRLKLVKRVKRLRSMSGASNCLEWAHRVEGGLGIRGEEFDRNPWLLACKNGIVELRTGRFRDGRPEDLITKAAPHDWQGIDAPAPLWEKFWNDVFDGDQTLCDFTQRFFGYSTTGLTILHIFLVMIGEEGRNGKGVCAETLMYTLGPELARPVQTEMLLDQRSARSSSAPSPDTMNLKGTRQAFASETDKNRRFAPSKVKWLSGGDRLAGRNPHDRYETHFEPTHQLILLTNDLPHAEASDRAFWDRLHLLPFNVRFVDNPKAPNERKKDNDLPERLRAEAPGILAWLVRGCLRWQLEGLNPPPIVRAATEQARVSEDLIAGFLDACAEPPGENSTEARTLLKEAYISFERWFSEFIKDLRFCPRKKEWGVLMEKHFAKKKVAGQLYFYGLALLEQENRN